jgi:hypothetical protein
MHGIGLGVHSVDALNSHVLMKERKRGTGTGTGTETFSFLERGTWNVARGTCSRLQAAKRPTS